MVLAAAAGTVDVPIITAVNATNNSLRDFMIIDSPFQNATLFHISYYIGYFQLLHLPNSAFINP